MKEKEAVNLIVEACKGRWEGLEGEKGGCDKAYFLSVWITEFYYPNNLGQKKQLN